MDLWLGQVSFGHTPKHKWPRQFDRGRVSDEGKCCFLVKVLTYEHRASLKITPTFSEDGARFIFALKGRINVFAFEGVRTKLSWERKDGNGWRIIRADSRYVYVFQAAGILILNVKDGSRVKMIRDKNSYCDDRTVITRQGLIAVDKVGRSICYHIS